MLQYLMVGIENKPPGSERVVVIFHPFPLAAPLAGGKLELGEEHTSEQLVYYDSANISPGIMGGPVMSVR